MSVALPGLETISGSCNTEESTCTFLSRCFAYLWATWGSWKTSLKIFVICTGCISAAWALGTSSIVLCRCIVHGDVTGRCRALLLFYSYCQRRVLGSRGLLVVYVFIFYQTLQVVPHGTKGTGPRFITRPAYLRSQFRNNTNTVSTLVPLIHLLQVLCTRYTSVAHHWVLQTSGRGWADSKAVHGIECSGARSLYWRSLSAGAAAWSVPYCQYREVCSPKRPNAKQANELRTKNPGSCTLVVYIAGDTASSANGSRSHDCAPVTWAYGIPCPAMVSPNAS